MCAESRIKLLLHFLKKICFNWRINALQNFVIFCQTSAWISRRYTCIPSLLNPFPTPSPSHPSRLIQSPCFEFPEPYSKFLLAIYFTDGNVSFHVTLSIHLTSPPLSPCSQVYSLCLFWMRSLLGTINLVIGFSLSVL